MPLETPSRTSIERKLHASGFEFEGVSTKYVLEFVPHPDDFGGDTIALEEFDAAKRVLSSLTLAGGRTRPIVDVFGSRTSRIPLRHPPRQSMSKKRSEESRVGKECVRTGRYRWSPDHIKKKKKN